MRFCSHTPARPLSDFVEWFWYCAGANVKRHERILPTGTFELVVNLAEDAVRIEEPRHARYSGAIVSGTYSRPFVIDAVQHVSMFGVHFKPGGAGALLGIPASELTDAHVDLSDVWAVSTLREQLCEAKSVEERFALMERVLIAKLARSFHPAVALALESFERSRGGVPIRDVVRDTGLSSRRFITLFREQVGLTPKFFCRVLRFHHARSLAHHMDWGEVALEARYADQAHLIHDFHEFSGTTPTEYLRRIAQDCMRNHVVA